MLPLEITHGRSGRRGYLRVQLELVDVSSRCDLRKRERQDGYPDQDQDAMANPGAKVSHGGMLSQSPNYFLAALYLSAPPAPFNHQGVFLSSIPPVRGREEGVMDLSDRRHQELVVLIGNRQRAQDRVRSVRPALRPPARRMAAQIGMTELEPRDADLAAPPANLARDVKEILLVDPDTDCLRVAQNALRFVAHVEVSSKFAAARARLLSNPPDLLVTNLRLQAYNGLHLVHMASGRTRCIVYSTYDDLVLAREVQAAGAFYERSNRLPRALAAYVHATLPPHDRRDFTAVDRRQILRGGRRCTDL